MRTLAVAALLAVSAPVFAAEGEVCQSTAKVLTDAEPAYPLTNEVAFNCPKVGSATIPQLYAKGWRVAHIWPAASMAPGGPNGLPRQTITYTIVIEKI